jgi:hypothetical protein
MHVPPKGQGRMTGPERCGHTVVDGEGIEQPCDRPATGWRWYQDVEHEDCLEPACEWHANEGGRRMHAAEAKVAGVEAVVEKWDLDRDRYFVQQQALEIVADLRFMLGGATL